MAPNFNYSIGLIPLLLLQLLAFTVQRVTLTEYLSDAKKLMSNISLALRLAVFYFNMLFVWFTIFFP